ncbi:hypothetical protein [Pseudomonas caricapapayae]|nr:hypothetical protein [Pseudomonas caricapapayae]
MSEEEMRQALFGSGERTKRSMTPPAQPPAATKKPVPSEVRRKTNKNFVPKLIVTLRVGNEYERHTELITHEADTLSHLQAEMGQFSVSGNNCHRRLVSHPGRHRLVQRKMGWWLVHE